MSPTRASPSWTPGPGMQDMSRRPAPGAFGFGWGEDSDGPRKPYTPEPGPSARGGAGRAFLSRPWRGSLGGVAEPQNGLFRGKVSSSQRLLGTLLRVPTQSSSAEIESKDPKTIKMTLQVRHLKYYHIEIHRAGSAALLGPHGLSYLCPAQCLMGNVVRAAHQPGLGYQVPEVPEHRPGSRQPAFLSCAGREGLHLFAADSGVC